MGILSIHTDAVERICDAGFVQRREWMLYMLRTDKAPFNVGLLFELPAFDPVQAEKVIGLMIRRHEILRTTLNVIDNNLRQMIHSPETFPLEFVFYDATDKPEAERSNYEALTMKESMRTPFDFESGPLFRILVFKMADHRYAIHIICHHLVTDNRSLGIFRRELSSLFGAVAQNKAVVLPEDHLQYSAYTGFENELLDTEKGDKHKRYWQLALQHGIPMLDIIDRNKAEIYHQRYLHKIAEVYEKARQLPYFDKRLLGTVIRRYLIEDAGKLKFVYPAAIFDKIKWYLQKSPNTLMSLLIGSLVQAFRKLSAQQVYAFEVVASSRASQKFNGTMGWLSSSAPCFFDITGMSSPDQILWYIDEQLYDLARHCMYPYTAALPDAMPPIGSRMPVFLNITQWEQPSGIQESGMIYTKPAGGGAYQDLTFFFDFYSDAGKLDLIFNNFLFTPQLVESILQEHIYFLENMLNDFCNKKHTV
jgi:hypothetical protein